MMVSDQSELLKEVAESLADARNKQYGSPRLNLDERTARLWTAYLRANEDIFYSDGFSGIDVCNMMILLKIARTMESPHIKDHWADIAGYAGAAWEVMVDRIY